MPVTNEPYDPIVLASWDTKPSPADSGKGRILVEFDTGQSYVSTGSLWKLLNGMWNTVLVQPSTDVYGNPQPIVVFKGTTLVDRNGVIQDSRAGTVGAITSTGGWQEAITFALNNGTSLHIASGFYGSTSAPLGQLTVQLPGNNMSPTATGLTIYTDGPDTVVYIGSVAGDFVHKYLGGVLNNTHGVLNIIGGYSVWNLNSAPASSGITFQYVRNVVCQRLKIAGAFASFTQNMIPISGTGAPPSGGVGFDWNCQSGDNFQFGPVTVGCWDIGFQLGGDHLFMVNPECRYCNSYNFLMNYSGFNVHLSHPHAFNGSGPCVAWPPVASGTPQIFNVKFENLHDEDGNSLSGYGPRGATIDFNGQTHVLSLLIDGMEISNMPSGTFLFLKTPYVSTARNIKIRNFHLASSVGIQAQQTSDGTIWFDTTNSISQDFSYWSLQDGIVSQGWNLNGTTAGQVVWGFSIPASNTAIVELNLSGYENTTATAQTITSPLIFQSAPTVIDLTNNTSAAVTATSTVITLPASMTATKTGKVLLYGTPKA